MKICTKCGREQADDEFHWRNKALGLRISHCRSCKSLWARDHYRSDPSMYHNKRRDWATRMQDANRLWIVAYLQTHPCIDCGEPDPIVLQFDHVRGDKRRAVSEMMAGARAALVQEVAKCDVRCANCHTRKTALERGYYRAANARPVEHLHGKQE